MQTLSSDLRLLFLLFCSDRWTWWISGVLISWMEITSWRWGCYGASFCTGRWGTSPSLFNRPWKCIGSLFIVYSNQIKVPRCLAWTGRVDYLEILRSASPRPKCQQSWFLLPRSSGGVWPLSILTASLLQNRVCWLMEILLLSSWHTPCSFPFVLWEGHQSCSFPKVILLQHDLTVRSSVCGSPTYK